MFAQMRHMAIVTSNANTEGDFYRDVFGMRRSSLQRAGGAVVVGDGYIGLNLNPRAPGRQAGFDHFGFEVEDVEVVFGRLKDKYPKIQVLHRPSNRPFAGISMHDPNGNVFDLSQANMENRRDIYTEKVEDRKRRIGHFGLRCVEPEECGEFYRDVFQLQEMEKPAGDPNHYLSDGKVTLAVMPWKISDFAGSGIERPALGSHRLQSRKHDAPSKPIWKNTRTTSMPLGRLVPRKTRNGKCGKNCSPPAASASFKWPIPTAC